MSDPTVIYLQPECCAEPDAGRLWCEHDAPVDCEDGKPWTKYILADLANEKDRQLKELAEAYLTLKRWITCPYCAADISDGFSHESSCKYSKAEKLAHGITGEGEVKRA
jgi:hypothetical protein